MSTQTDPHDSASNRLSQQLGVDVDFVEMQAAFRLDHARLQRGEPAQMGYVRIMRQNDRDLLVVFPDHDTAALAVDDDGLIDSLAEDDCLDCYAYNRPVLSDLVNSEIVFAA